MQILFTTGNCCAVWLYFLHFVFVFPAANGDLFIPLLIFTVPVAKFPTLSNSLSTLLFTRLVVQEDNFPFFFLFYFFYFFVVSSLWRTFICLDGLLHRLPSSPSWNFPFSYYSGYTFAFFFWVIFPVTWISYLSLFRFSLVWVEHTF